ncbi:hypothetical protein PENSPDRAFT_695206 [Peniophora sp. CONT]|nr:hypothetical protein PENSPDRAFT_695206 [Peniophora sp. CONT]
MADITNPSTDAALAAQQQQQQQQQQPPEIDTLDDAEVAEHLEDTGSEPSEVDLDELRRKVNEHEGVQGHIARALLLLTEDARKRHDHRTETRKPTDFKGTENAREARNWLQSLELYYDNRKVIHDSERITTALSYCVGKAAEFARRMTMERDENFLKTWNQFKREFTRSWITVDIATTAREEIRNLRMSKDQKAEEFVIEFMNLASETGYGSIALIDRFKESLIPRLCRKIMELPKREEGKARGLPGYRPESLDDWCKYAISFDSSYRESLMYQNDHKDRDSNRGKDTKKDNSQNSSSSQSRPHNNFNRGSNNSQNRQNNGQGQGQTQTRKVQFQTRAAQGPDERVCYRCDKIGHIARNCPTLPSGSQTRKPALQTRQTTTPQDVFASIPDDTLTILARALQSASSQRAAAQGDAKGKTPETGFRRSRK